MMLPVSVVIVWVTVVPIIPIMLVVNSATMAVLSNDAT